MAVEEHRVQAGLVVTQAAGGEQGGGVQGGPQKGHGLALLLLGLAVGRQGSQDPPAQPDLQHPSLGLVTRALQLLLPSGIKILEWGCKIFALNKCAYPPLDGCV